MLDFKYSPHNDFKTTKGNVAPDFHLASADFSEVEKSQVKRSVEQQFPRARVVGNATATYNCHGYAHAGSHSWFDKIERFLEDDYYKFTPGTLRVEDIVVYVKNNKLTHSGFIKRLSGNTILEIRSKWGNGPEVVHAPDDVPAVYGSILYYLRKRDTALTDCPEPTAEQLADEIKDIFAALTTKDHINSLIFASTLSAARQVVSEFPEITELMLYGPVVWEALITRFSSASDKELPVLAYAIESLGCTEALPAVAERVSALADDNSLSVRECFLLSAFEHLNNADILNRKNLLIDAARNVK